jgi:hypothetical protein
MNHAMTLAPPLPAVEGKNASPPGDESEIANQEIRRPKVEIRKNPEDRNPNRSLTHQERVPCWKASSIVPRHFYGGLYSTGEQSLKRSFAVRFSGFGF